MKNCLVFILLAISVSSAVIPCCQIDDCSEDQLASSNSNHQNHTDNEACSPFNSCTTCCSFVELASLNQLVQPMVVKRVHCDNLGKFNPSTYTASFWQPPRSC